MPCPEGNAAVKVVEYENFEELPNYVMKRCKIIDPKVAKQGDCAQSYGWRIDGGMIDSGIGIAQGLRQSLVFHTYVIDETHGSLEIDYQTLGFTSTESFTVYIDNVPRCKLRFTFTRFRYTL